MPESVGGIELQPAEDGYVVYQPEEDRIHFLNSSAVLVLQLCDGKSSEAEITRWVEDAYAGGIKPKAVAETIRELAKAGLVRFKEKQPQC